MHMSIRGNVLLALVRNIGLMQMDRRLRNGRVLAKQVESEKMKSLCDCATRSLQRRMIPCTSHATNHISQRQVVGIVILHVLTDPKHNRAIGTSSAQTINESHNLDQDMDSPEHDQRIGHQIRDSKPQRRPRRASHNIL